MPDPTLAPRRVYLAAASVLAIVAAGPAMPETRPTLNYNGATGLIDMPSGEAQPDGQLSITTAHFGPISRNTLSFQITPRLSGSFRYSAVRDWNANIPIPDQTGTDSFETYYDRSFDLRYQVLTESRYLPAVTIGLQDFAGTGVFAGEYVAATKNILPNLKVTAGLGWGRLGSYGEIGSPFGPRPEVDIGRGGNFNFDQWFRGPAAAFGGVEWQINDKWGLKAEYSSDAYVEEADERGTFERSSPFNFGVEYQARPNVRLGAHYLYGSEVGLTAHFTLNPKQPTVANQQDVAPPLVRSRPSRAADPDAWSQEWVSQQGANPVLRGNIAKQLEDDGILIEALGYTSQTAQVRIRNTRYNAEAQAIGRVARAMSRTMPASVEVFEIVPVVDGVPLSKVTLRRSDIEALDLAPDGAESLRSRAVIGEAGPAIAGLTYDPDLYPAFTWGLSPYVRTSLFDPDKPFRADVGLRLSAKYAIAPGFVLAGSVTQKIAGNLDDSRRDSNSVLPRVRTDGNIYDEEGETALEKLTLAWQMRPAENLYGRVTVGYLERMFGGVSGELLWKPTGSRLALGAEVNYAKQRDFDQRFGFQDYDIVTGHVSAYYEISKDFHGQIDVGRYLAGDVGATLSLHREFENGWRVGAFATKTNVSAEEFGEGSFDKGIRIEVPLNHLLGRPTRDSGTIVVRPITRDGGARLNVDGRLYETVRDYHETGINQQWGTFWK
ncbi:YjbH domain-containing protein [Fertoebacter nigrum]|uniref:YjbH domain-containing protein n=1 Tax=Fertoeibacter niger TaxID=2656921 RepID=A0A8X8H8C8_9RHOB|nr:YjbH domain-containing protein [Fertoeibacter niger]NUB45391.1 YjbH domain-containing protein [Fertoeibacter niger]